ncbi:MAG: glycoside hydrolase family 5 protein [Fibrobacterales bacterium]
MIQNKIKRITYAIIVTLIGFSTSSAEGPVDVYGEMKVSGRYFVGSSDKYKESLVQVKGLSFFWNQWGGQSQWNAGVVDIMVDDYSAEVLRVPVSTSRGGKRANLNDAAAVIDQCIKRGIYIIIDFHAHHAHEELSEAKEFFTNAVNKYGNNDHVIFEVYNEPDTEDWGPVRDYGNAIVKHIRDAGSDNLIIMGTPKFDQIFDGIKEDPVIDPANNLAYAMHFYSYSHKVDDDWLGGNFNVAIKQELPIFVSEWGTSHSDGGQGGSTFDGESADEWHAILDRFGWSSAMWSIHSDGQSSAIWGNSGQADGYIKNLLSTWKEIADWRTGATRAIPDEFMAYDKKYSVASPNTTVTLEADYGGGAGPFSFSWFKKSAAEAKIGNATGETTEITNLAEGTYTFGLTVKDGQGSKSKSVHTVVIGAQAAPESSEDKDEKPSSADDTNEDHASSSKGSDDKADDDSSGQKADDYDDGDDDKSSSSQKKVSDSDDNSSSSDGVIPIITQKVKGSSHVGIAAILLNGQTVSLGMAQSGHYQVTVWAVTGEKLADLGNHYLEQGNNSVQLPKEVSQATAVVRVVKQ